MRIKPPHQMTRTFSLVACALGAALALSACAPALRVTLLPQVDGKPSAVVVQTPDGKEAAVLDQPYGQARLNRSGSAQLASTDAASVAEHYPSLLALKPAPRAKFVLNFVTGTADLTPESQALLPSIVEKAKTYEGGEMIVTGHTDNVGSAGENDALSLLRAAAVRDVLLAQGFVAHRVEVVGRGQREPIKMAPAGTDEPLNRRVEIELR